MAGKGFTRYYQDPDFRRDVDEQFARAKEATEPGRCLTYVIHDPSRVDHIGGEPDGLIIYVGETKEFNKRVPKRMREAGTATRRPKDQIAGACYDIMSNNGPVPRFTVRDRTSCKLDSLVSETKLAKQLLGQGYPLLNKWTEQKFAGGEVTRESIPHERLWPMTVSDAIASGIDLIVRDAETGEESVADLHDMRQEMRLRDLKPGLKKLGLRPRLYVRPRSDC